MDANSLKSEVWRLKSQGHNMPTFIDTHAHLYLEQFDEDRIEVIANAQEHGLLKIYLPNIDKTSIDSMIQMEQDYPGVCFPMMGLHPCSVGEDVDYQLALVEEWLGKREFAAVGEIGTDLYWDKTFKDQQEEAFRKQIRWAKELGLPIVIHSRETLEWNINIVEEERGDDLTGIFHCFNGTIEQAARIAGMGFYMGLGGVVTFKNGGMDKVVPHINKEYCVLETDAPYLTPAPHRGKRNESAYVAIVAEKVAEFWEMDVEEVARLTTANAGRVFNH